MANQLRRVFLAAPLLLPLAAVTACGSGPVGLGSADTPGTQMNAEEVRARIIGTPFQGQSGIYHFRPDGMFTYRSQKTTIVRPPAKYELSADGSLKTESNRFTFYRIGSAIRYFNARSEAYFLLRPVKPAEGS